MRRSRSKIFDLRAGGFQDLRISKGSQPPPPFRIDTVCLRFTGEEACCFRVVSTASCIKVACVQASLLFRVAADTSIPGKETTGEKRHGKNYQGYTTLIDCSSPSTSFWDVARFRYTGNYSQKRRNAIKRDVFRGRRTQCPISRLSRTDLPPPLSLVTRPLSICRPLAGHLVRGRIN